MHTRLTQRHNQRRIVTWLRRLAVIRKAGKVNQADAQPQKSGSETEALLPRLRRSQHLLRAVTGTNPTVRSGSSNATHTI